MLSYYLLLLDEEGERTKFSELYKIYKYNMLYIANDILRDYGLAEDAVQNAFLYFVVHINTIKDVHSMATKNYIYLVTKHRAIDIARKRKKEIYLTTAELDSIGGGYSHVESLIIKEETNQEIYALILNLPEIYRKCLELNIVYDLSAKRIASILELKYETVKKRIQRGKELLESKL